MMHQAAYRYCRPEASIKFDTYHVEGRTIVIATVPPSEKRPVCALGDDDKPRAYIRIADENFVASPVHLAMWRDAQNARGAMMTYTDRVSQLLDSLQGGALTLTQLVRRTKIPRPKVIMLLARLIRFNIVTCKHVDQQYWFGLSEI